MLENQTRLLINEPVHSGKVFTVVWQGVTFDAEAEDAQDFITEVIPAQYGYIAVPVFKEVWGAIACGEEHNGDNPYDRIDVIAVIEGGVILVETDDRAED